MYATAENRVNKLKMRPIADHHTTFVISAPHILSCSWQRPTERVPNRFRITIHRTAEEITRLKPVWDKLRLAHPSTIFQDFDWNMLAARSFTETEAPFVVYAESEQGAAIVPAVIRHSDSSLRLLGEEMFDYRAFLHSGDEETLCAALASLAETGCAMEVVAMRECDCVPGLADFSRSRFSAAPWLDSSKISGEQFSHVHTRLARNLRRLERLGFALKTYDGNQSQVLRLIYESKALQDENSLFRNPERLEFVINLAKLRPEETEIFLLASGSRLAAALVTFRDGSVRRFYTNWFDSEFRKHSPGMVLIYEVTRLSLIEGLSCDYMTGEQPYKIRMARDSMRLYRLAATSAQLAHFAEPQATAVHPAA